MTDHTSTPGLLDLSVEDLKRYGYYAGIAANLMSQDSALVKALLDNGYEDPTQVLRDLSRVLQDAAVALDSDEKGASA